MQHESSEAWAAAETGGAESPAVTQEAEQPQGTCTSSDASQVDNAVGATDITDLDEACSIIQDCSVVVGIHPDQVWFRSLSRSHAMLAAELLQGISFRAGHDGTFAVCPFSLVMMQDCAAFASAHL